MSNENISEQVSAEESAAVVDATAEEVAAVEEGEVETTEPTLEEQLEAARTEAAKNLDSSLRAQAELSNARKRFEKERAQVYTNANADIVAKLLPILDDFERALENVPEDIASDSWFSGLELVHRKMVTILESLKVEPIAAVGEPFNPNFHEALGQIPSDEHESGTVAREMLRGYKLGDRVIRPSLVYVAE